MWRGLKVAWDGDSINFFAEKLCVFCILGPDTGKDTFFVRHAQRWHNKPNQITEEDITAANSYQGRMSAEVGRRLQRLQGLSRLLKAVRPEWDLFGTKQQVWNDAISHVQKLLTGCVGVRGVAVATATKVLHLKRPNLIPICDSVVMGRLIQCSDSTNNVERAMECIERFRTIGGSQENHAVLCKAREHLRQVLQEGNAYHGLSLVKVLDSVLWVDTKVEYWPLLEW